MKPFLEKYHRLITIAAVLAFMALSLSGCGPYHVTTDPIQVNHNVSVDLDPFRDYCLQYECRETEPALQTDCVNQCVKDLVEALGNAFK